MLGFVGVTAMEVRVALVTVSIVLPDTLPSVAVIVAVPAASALATPMLPAALLSVATDVFDELHVTAAVTSWVELSEYFPVAVKATVTPAGALGAVGVTSIVTSVAGVTVTLAEPDTAPTVAMTVAEPGATPVASAPAVIVSVPCADELHVACAVTSCLLPSL
jgi:hypothetical protein